MIHISADILHLRNAITVAALLLLLNACTAYPTSNKIIMSGVKKPVMVGYKNVPSICRMGKVKTFSAVANEYFIFTANPKRTIEKSSNTLISTEDIIKSPMEVPERKIIKKDPLFEYPVYIKRARITFTEWTLILIASWKSSLKLTVKQCQK